MNLPKQTDGDRENCDSYALGMRAVALKSPAISQKWTDNVKKGASKMQPNVKEANRPTSNDRQKSLEMSRLMT